MSDHIEQPQEDTRSQLREYLAVLWVRKWSILLVTVLVVGGALFYSFRQEPVYRSQARILTQQPSAPAAPGGAPSAAATVNLQTESQILSSTEVAEKVAEEVDTPLEPRRLLSGLSVQIQPETQIIAVGYVSRDPIQAQRLAQTFAETYLEHRLEQVVEERDAQSRVLQRQIERLGKQQAQLETKINQLPEGSPELSLEQGRWSSLQARMGVLEQQLYALPPPNSLQVGEIIEDATLPSAPTSPNHVRTGGIAGVIGLVLGIGVAFLRERLDDRLRGRADLERHAGAPVLAIVPHVSNWRRKNDTPLITAAEPRSGVAEAYRTLRTSLLFAAEQRGAKTVMVTSAHEGEGKTATAANLGLSLAQAGKRVILLAADLRKPRLHRFFGTNNDGGLTSILSGELKPWEGVVDVGHENLRIVPSGPVPANPAELLGSDAMGRLIAQFAEVADIVLIDSPPVLVVADALALAPLTDAVLFVADAERTSRGTVAHARQQLEQMDAPIIGAMLNNFDPSKGRKTSYYYYGYYYSHYQYEEARRGRRRWTGRRRPAAPSGFETRGAVAPKEDVRAEAVWSESARGSAEPQEATPAAPTPQPDVPATTPPPEAPAPVAGPGPAASAPEPEAWTQPQPSAAEAEAAAPQSQTAEPLAPQPEPFAPQPEPVASQPEPVAPQPQAEPVAPQPPPAKPYGDGPAQQHLISASEDRMAPLPQQPAARPDPWEAAEVSLPPLAPHEDVAEERPAMSGEDEDRPGDGRYSSHREAGDPVREDQEDTARAFPRE